MILFYNSITGEIYGADSGGSIDNPDSIRFAKTKIDCVIKEVITNISMSDMHTYLFNGSDFVLKT